MPDSKILRHAKTNAMPSAMAIHEAGHAVVMLALGGPGSADYIGDHFFRPAIRLSDPRKCAAMQAAGCVAQELAGVGYGSEASDDDDVVQCALEHIHNQTERASFDEDDGSTDGELIYAYAESVRKTAIAQQNIAIRACRDAIAPLRKHWQDVLRIARLVDQEIAAGRKGPGIFVPLHNYKLS